MPNPVLNDKTLRSVAASEEAPGWAATQRLETAPGPVDDGPISPYRSGRFTAAGAARVTGILFALPLLGGVGGWLSVSTTPEGEVSFPAWLLLPMFAALGVAFLTFFSSTRPADRSGLRPAPGRGAGGHLHVYEAQWDGIVVQAVLGTAGVFGAMLFLYAQRIIKVTDRFRRW